MSFGWSVGDITDAIKILKQVHDAFNHADSSARSQYIESVHFTQVLQDNLQLIQSYVDKVSFNEKSDTARTIHASIGLVKTEWNKLYTFLKERYELIDVDEGGLRRRLRKVLKTVDFGIRDLGAKLMAMKHAISGALTMLGVSLAHELKYVHFALILL